MSAQVVAVIFARGGSKGVVRKNLRVVGGKSLIGHAVSVARESARIDRVIVSTDDSEIAAEAKAFGADVPFLRPAELASDVAPEWLAWQHAVRHLQEQPGGDGLRAMVSVPPTSPLRTVADLDACVQALLDSEADIVITVRPAERNPYFNMVTLDEAGHAQLAMKGGTTWRRQDAPAMFDITTVAYAVRPAFVLSASSMFEGLVKAVVIPTERSLDIDSEIDLRVAECLMTPR